VKEMDRILRQRHKLKPDAETKNESKKATKEANDDLKESSEQG